MIDQVKKLVKNPAILNREFEIKKDEKKHDRYVSVIAKFSISQVVAILWVILSINLSRLWLEDLAVITTFPIAVFIIAGIAYIPGYLNAMMVSSLLLDRQPHLKNLNPTQKITILIAARNEGERIHETLRYISEQDYV